MENLKKIRKEHKINQQELAEKINVHQTLISKIEKGQSDITGSLLIKICKTLNCSSDELLGLK